MDEFKKNLVTLDICPLCNGIWFDSNELFQSSEEISADSFINSSTLIKQTEISCPNCSTNQDLINLDLYKFSKQNIEIEFEKCPNCNGIWLDNGEFQKIRQAYSFKPNNKKIISRASTIIEGSLEDEIYSNYKNAKGANPTSIKTYIISLLLGIPFEYENKTINFPWTIFFIIAINFLLYFIIYFSRDLYLIIFTNFTVSLKNILNGKLYTTFTYAFIHMSFLHVALNMYFMWIFGDNIYDIFLLNGKKKGRINFIIYFLICAIIAGFGHILNVFFSKDFYSIPLAGASGVTSALVASYYRLFPKAKFFMVVFFIPIYGKIKYFVIFYLGSNLIYALKDGINSKISWQTHLAGFIAGYFLIEKFIPKKALHIQD